jgi:hypothetical protein
MKEQTKTHKRIKNDDAGEEVKKGEEFRRKIMS